MAGLVETMHHAEMLWRQRGEKNLSPAPLFSDNNRTQYFIKIKCPEHAPWFTGLIKDGVTDVGETGTGGPGHCWCQAGDCVVTDGDQAPVRGLGGGRLVCKVSTHTEPFP